MANMSKILFIIFSIGFVLIRVRFHNPEQSDQTEVQPFRESILATQFSLALLTSHGWWLSQDSGGNLDTWYLWLGASLMGLSLPLLYWVHHSLGTYFSARLVLQPKHTIIQNGPYRWIRHPMYSVGFLYLIGAGLLSHSWFVGVVPTLSFTVLVWLRIQDEEIMLCSLSEEYVAYMERTGRFLPKL